MEATAPDKQYLKIGEVAQITSLKPSVLRFWESEFPQLQPEKSWSGQRLYTRGDVDLICEIKNLLYLEKMTIEGARKRLLERGEEKEQKGERQQLMAEIMAELMDIRDSL
jgi:DNA-binding transcriptional MerR regulator